MLDSKGVAHVFDKDLIVLMDQTFENKGHVISYLSHLANPNVDDAEKYQEDVFAREAAIATFIGFGTAMPHAKSTAANKPFVIYARLKEPVQWGDENEFATQLFMIGVPHDASGKNARLHLQIIAALSRSLIHESFRRRLDEAQSQEAIFALLKEIEEEIQP